MIKHILYFVLLLCSSTLIMAQNNAIFNGGSTDGHSRDCYTQTSNLNTTFSKGGSGDGHSKDCYTQTSNLNTTFSKGGSGDGHSKDCYTQTSNLNTTFSKGGSGDGHSKDCYTQSPILTVNFSGGSNDGHAKDCYTQSPVLTVNFSGGSNDGHSKDCYTQASNLNPIYSGGNGGDGMLNGCANEPLGCFLAINLGNDTSFCNGNTLSLNAGSFSGGATYFWQDSSTAQTLIVNITGVYYVFVTDTAGCTGVDSITVTVNPNNTVSAASSTPTVCINTAITNITHTTTLATGIGAATGLPAGVTANWVGGTITISGTPTASGTFNYSIPLSGGCGTVNATGTITVTPLKTVTAASSTPTVCINTAITNITHTTTLATGIAAATGLPAGVTASWAGGTITITGTPTASGTFNYSIPLSGGCGTVNATGTITVTPNKTVTAASLTPTVCINTAITNITHTTTLATGIGAATGLPAGVTANWATGTITISGTPTVSGTFNYSIPLTGGCGTVNATGTITVTPLKTVTAASSTPIVCINTAITNITHTTTLATGIGAATGLPAGVTANWVGGTITISGTPTASGTFNYSIPLSGGCGTVNATGTITVTPNKTVTAASSTPIVCINTAITNITHTTTLATGIGAATGLPAGVTANWVGGTITISGTPTVSGTFNYSIPLTGGCGTVNATGTITVTPNKTVTAASSTPTVCINTAIINITHTTTLATGIGAATGLPAGVTANWVGGTITISGTPTVSGTFNYSIPLTGGCGTVNATGTITVNPNVTPTFTAVSPICSGGVLAALPTTSNNSITGTWSPAINNTATTTYTFTPTAGLCATTTTLTITVNPITTTNLSNEIVCQGDSALIFGAYQTVAGNYYDTLISSTSCDSFLVKQLIVNPIYNINLGTTTICSGDSALIFGNHETIAGVYSDTLTTINGCDSIVNQTLAVLSNSSVNLGNDTAFCAGNSIVLDAGSGTSYLWQNGITNTQTYAVSTSGLYYVTVSLGACSATDSINITVNPIVTTNLANETACQGDSALIFGTYQTIAGNYYDTLIASTGCDSILVKQLIVNPIYNQNLGTVTICNGDSALILGNYETTAGIYSDTLTSINGCDSIVSQSLSVSPSHLINLGNDTTFCAGNNLLLNAVAGATSYQWMNGIGLPYNQQTYTVSGTGAYYVVTTLGACITSDTINVTVNPIVTTNLSDEVVCQGDSVLIFGNYQTIAGNYYDTLTASTGCDSILVKQLLVNPIYNQNLGTVTICNGDSALILGNYETFAGIYSDTLTSINGCDSIVSQQLIVNPYHVIDLGPDTSICENSTIILDAGAGAAGYIWQNTPLSGYMNQTFGASGAGAYYVVATIGVCSSSDTINVNVIPTIYTNLANVETCQGDSVLIFGNYETVAGNYSQTLIAATGCDSVLLQQLIIHPNYVTPQAIGICQGDSILLGGSYQYGAGTFYDTLQSVNSCDSIIATSLIIYPTYTINTSTTICDGDSMLLGGSYQTIAGVYSDIYSTINSCDSTVNTTLIVNPVYVVNQNVEICQGDSIYLGGAYQNFAGVYTDIYTSTLSCDSTVITTLGIKSIPTETLTPITICDNDSVLIFGNYQTLAATYSQLIPNGAVNGCDSIVYQQLLVNPTYQIFANATICSGDSILLGGAYQTIAGIYVDVYTSSLTCDSTITTTLIIVNSFIININDTICEGDSILLAGTYQTLAGTYSELLQSIGGCDSLVTTELYVNPYPVITLTAEPELILLGQSSQLTATGGGVYSWIPTSSLSCVNCANPIASPTETTLYTVEVNLSGCMVSDTITVNVDSEFKIPEGFSPNGDGVNDVFEIVGISQFPNNKIIIINRWGSKVFEAAPYKSDWDGTSHFGITIGEKLPASTYFYILDLGKEGPEGQQEIKGYIYINR